MKIYDGPWDKGDWAFVIGFPLSIGAGLLVVWLFFG